MKLIFILVTTAVLFSGCSSLNTYAGQSLLAIASLSAGELIDSSDPNSSRVKIQDTVVKKEPGDNPDDGAVIVTGLIRYLPAKRGGTQFTNWTQAILQYNLLDQKKKVLTTQAVRPVFPDSVDVRSIEAKHDYPFTATMTLPLIQWERTENVKLTAWSSQSY